MKSIMKAVISVAVLTVIVIGPAFAAVQSCCDTPTCCGSSCCHHAK